MRLDQDGRNIRRLQDCESGLFDMSLVQIIDATEFSQYRFGKFETVVDGRCLRQIDQHLLQCRIGHVDIYPADQIGLVFFSCKPSGRR